MSSSLQSYLNGYKKANQILFILFYFIFSCSRYLFRESQCDISRRSAAELKENGLVVHFRRHESAAGSCRFASRRRRQTHFQAATTITTDVELKIKREETNDIIHHILVTTE